jgi:hypothetical protein
MTELSLTPLILSHVAICLIAIGLGFHVLGALLQGRLPAQSNQLFLLFTFLTSATGLVIAPPAPPPSPAQITAIVALIALGVSLYAFYLRHMAGRWRAVYVVTAIIGLYLNVFVLVVQVFTKADALVAFGGGNPPGGPVFGAVQLSVLVGFILAGRAAVKRYRAIPA